MDAFVYVANPARVVFGSGTLSQLPTELANLNIHAPLVFTNDRQLSTSSTLRELISSIKPAGIFKGATMHTPIQVTEAALAVLRSTQADGILSIGGGSAIGLGKALSIRTSLPHLCVPTTYAGSEMTSTLGETKDGRKTTRSDPQILPRTVIYDVQLTTSLPTELTATSGVNAIAHAVEALYSAQTNPVTSLLALDGIRALALSLPGLMSGDPKDIKQRTDTLYGAWVCSLVLGNATMGVHHKLCHTLGGSFGLPHSPTHTIVLPHAFAYNAPAVSEDVKKKLADVLPGSEGDPVKGLNKLLEGLGFKGRGLKEYGLKEEDVAKAAEIAVEKEYANPRKVEQEKIKEVIRRAWAGEQARADL